MNIIIKNLGERDITCDWVLVEMIFEMSELWKVFNMQILYDISKWTDCWVPGKLQVIPEKRLVEHFGSVMVCVSY